MSPIGGSFPWTIELMHGHARESDPADLSGIGCSAPIQSIRRSAWRHAAWLRCTLRVHADSNMPWQGRAGTIWQHRVYVR